MKILHRNANAQLFEKAHSLEGAHNSWRSIHLHMASKRERYSQMLRTYFIVRGLTETLADNDGYIYLCNDGDIFILFQGALRPVLAKLSHYFGDIDLSQAVEKPQNSFFTIFDLSKDWQEFLNLCFAKSLLAEAFDETHDYIMSSIVPSYADTMQDG